MWHAQQGRLTDSGVRSKLPHRRLQGLPCCSTHLSTAASRATHRCCTVPRQPLAPHRTRRQSGPGGPPVAAAQVTARKPAGFTSCFTHVLPSCFLAFLDRHEDSTLQACQVHAAAQCPLPTWTSLESSQARNSGSSPFLHMPHNPVKVLHSPTLSPVNVCIASSATYKLQPQPSACCPAPQTSPSAKTRQQAHLLHASHCRAGPSSKARQRSPHTRLAALFHAFPGLQAHCQRSLRLQRPCSGRRPQPAHRR